MGSLSARFFLLKSLSSTVMATLNWFLFWFTPFSSTVTLPTFCGLFFPAMVNSTYSRSPRRRSWSISSWLRAIRVPISLRAIFKSSRVVSRSVRTPPTLVSTFLRSSDVAFLASSLQLPLRNLELLGHHVQVALQVGVGLLILRQPILQRRNVLLHGLLSR